MPPEAIFRDLAPHHRNTELECTMFIFDAPYISDVAEAFLIDSQAPLLKNDFSMASISPKANQVSEDEAIKELERQNLRWVYSNSENAIGWIVKTFGADSDLARKIELFKNKGTFRKATATLFPDITFIEIPASEVETFTFDRVGSPFIIKPSVGFISAGVHRVNNSDEWETVRGDLLKETEETAKAFPKEVLSSTSFIIESIIDGDEFAVDAYFDDENKPVILNVLHHKFSHEHDMSDRLYLTSAEIINTHRAPIEAFLRDIATLGDFRGLPFHAEIRIDAKNTIRPIEINPLRFAGWCSTDIAHYAYGINVYDYFANKKTPDWPTILEASGTDTHAMAVIERPTPLSDNQRFDYDKLEKTVSSVHALRKMDYRTFPLYAFLFFKVSPETSHELGMMLTLDPDAFVISQKKP